MGLLSTKLHAPPVREKWWCGCACYKLNGVASHKLTLIAALSRAMERHATQPVDGPLQRTRRLAFPWTGSDNDITQFLSLLPDRYQTDRPRRRCAEYRGDASAPRPQSCTTVWIFP